MTKNLLNRNVTYTLFKDKKFYIIENVPARVDQDTGEQYFAPDTVEKIQFIINKNSKPVRTIETPVYEFS